jgi:transketolase
MIVDAATSTGLVVTLEDHFVTGALFSITSEILVRRGIRSVVVPLALEERWFRPGLLDDVLDYEGFSAEKIADRVLQLVQRRRYVREGFE